MAIADDEESLARVRDEVLHSRNLLSSGTHECPVSLGGIHSGFSPCRTTLLGEQSVLLYLIIPDSSESDEHHPTFLFSDHSIKRDPGITYSP